VGVRARSDCAASAAGDAGDAAAGDLACCASPASGTRETIDQLLTPHLHQLRAGIEFGKFRGQSKRAAASGLGISCLSRYVVEDFLTSGLLVAPASELPRLTRRFHLVTHALKVAHARAGPA